MKETVETRGTTVAGLWRYPVKSMIGEEMESAAVIAAGLLGDRAYALVDRETGKVASAKNPSKWPGLLVLRAAFAVAVEDEKKLPAVVITLPDGTRVVSGHPGVDEALSRVLGRRVTLEARSPSNPRLEEYWPDIEGLAHREAVTEETMPEGTFFDCATVHLLTTATLARLRQLYPEGRFEPRRFRPNVLVDAPGDVRFVENDWIGRTVAIGDEVRLSVTGPCPRCVMTTLAQDDLPKDPGILRAAAKHNGANVGVYAAVVRGGRIRRGDAVTVA